MNGNEAAFELDEEIGGADGASVEEERRMRLQWIRDAPRTLNEATVRAAQALAARLNREIATGHDAAAFTVALLLAAAKDALDLGGEVIQWFVLAIPGIGPALWIIIYYLTLIGSLFLGAFLTYFLWGKGWFNRWKIRIIYIIIGLFIDNLPAFRALPINVLTVLWAWHIVRHRAREAADELENLERDVGATLAEAEENAEAETET